jgi:hypothetical protein
MHVDLICDDLMCHSTFRVNAGYTVLDMRMSCSSRWKPPL